MWTEISVDMEGREEFEGDVKQKVRPDEEEGGAGGEGEALDLLRGGKAKQVSYVSKVCVCTRMCVHLCVCACVRVGQGT